MLYRHFKEGNVYLKVGKVYDSNKSELDSEVLYFSFNDKRFYRRSDEEFNNNGLKRMYGLIVSMKRFKKLTVWEHIKFIFMYALSGGKKCKI